jgi:hypothetical protein
MLNGKRKDIRMRNFLYGILVFVVGWGLVTSIERQSPFIGFLITVSGLMGLNSLAKNRFTKYASLIALVISTGVLCWELGTVMGPALSFILVCIVAVGIKLKYYPAKCPSCNNNASWITIDKNGHTEQKRQTIIREDVKLDRKGEYDGKTIRLEQVDVKIFEWEVITKCEHCNYVKSTEKRKEAVPL